MHFLKQVCKNSILTGDVLLQAQGQTTGMQFHALVAKYFQKPRAILAMMSATGGGHLRIVKGPGDLFHFKESTQFCAEILVCEPSWTFTVPNFSSMQLNTIHTLSENEHLFKRGPRLTREPCMIFHVCF